MESLVFLLVMLGVIVVGTSVLLLRAREPKGEYRGIKSFQREMRALAPEGARTGNDGDDEALHSLDPLLPAASGSLGPAEETETPAVECQE
jgi:hypothetical protein